MNQDFLNAVADLIDNMAAIRRKPLRPFLERISDAVGNPGQTWADVADAVRGLDNMPDMDLDKPGNNRLRVKIIKFCDMVQDIIPQLAEGYGHHGPGAMESEAVEITEALVANLDKPLSLDLDGWEINDLPGWEWQHDGTHDVLWEMNGSGRVYVNGNSFVVDDTGIPVAVVQFVLKKYGLSK